MSNTTKVSLTYITISAMNNDIKSLSTEGTERVDNSVAFVDTLMYSTSFRVKDIFLINANVKELLLIFGTDKSGIATMSTR